MNDINVVDVFAGCGGFSRGFEMAGFKIEAAIEIDEWAALTYANNHTNTKVINKPIEEVIELNSITSKKVSGIIGGPPCQGFSLSGNRDPKDPRNSLFLHFVRFVDFYKPDFFVMENVQGILSMCTKSGDKVSDIILEEFSKCGYSVAIKLLNAADHGVPQTRKRVFFIGVLKNKSIDPELLFPEIKLTPDKYITISDALSDLPTVEPGSSNEKMNYGNVPINEYQKIMRSNSSYVHNHIPMRHTKRIIERFKNIGHGQSSADVGKEHMQRKRGNSTEISGKVYSQNNMRPFPTKASPTIPASFQSNFVHPFYDRNYTAREGARLQSFPDDYIFYGKRTTMSWEKNLSQYQQIGNAVPPLLSKSIADNIMSKLYN